MTLRYSSGMGAIPLALAVAVGACARGDSRSGIELPVEALTLDSGVKVILHRDSTVPLVFLQSCFRASAADDPRGKAGLAHMVEHLAVRGPDLETSFDPGMGVSGVTDFDATCYKQRLPANALEVGLWRERERLTRVASVSEDRMEAERQSVVHEIRERLASRADFADLVAIREAVWPELADWGGLPLGRNSDVARLNRLDAEAFLRTWYVPAAVTLVVAGDFELPALRRQVTHWLGDLPLVQQPGQTRLSKASTLRAGRKILTGPPDGRLSVTHGWRVPGPFQPGNAELVLLARVLGDGDQGRMAAAFRKLGIGFEGNSRVEVEAGMGAFLVNVTPVSRVPVSEVERVMDGVLEGVVRQPVTASEHGQALALTEARLSYDLDSLEGRSERMQFYQRHVGRPDGWTDDLARFRRTTPASLQQAARSLLDRSQRVEVVSIPAGETHDSAPP